MVKYISSIANESKYSNKENYLLMVFAKLKIAKRTKIWGMQIYDDEKLISKGKLKSQILYALTTMPIVYSAMLGMSIV